MKKILTVILCVVLIAAVYVVAITETHYGVKEMVDAGLSESEILAEMPELAITEEERLLGERLLADETIQSLLPRQAGDAVELDKEQTLALLGDLQSDAYYRLTVMGTNVLVSRWDSDQETIITYQSDGNIIKTIGIYDDMKDGETAESTVVYESNGETLTKYEAHRRWLAYFRDRMWESV